jgi:hypothetical protein
VLPPYPVLATEGCSIHRKVQEVDLVMPFLKVKGAIGDALSPGECEEVVCHLEEASRAGFSIVTWNGIGFDFPILATKVPHLKSRLQSLALNHVDIMFHIYCLKGFPLAMEAAAKGMGISAKKIMKSDDVPTMWGTGKRQAVIDYVNEDVEVTIQLAEKIARRKEISWVSKTGNPALLQIPEIKLVKDCMNIPLPDVSWMKSSVPRENYVGWCLDSDS